jgi:hypothetical protein
MRRFALILAAALALCLAPTALADGPLIYIANASKSVPQAQVDAAIPAFQYALDRDFAPVWGTDGVLSDNPADAQRAQMTIEIDDSSPKAGVEGEHGVANSHPKAWIYAAESASWHDDWRLVFTHELWEMLADPWVNRGVWMPGRKRFYFQEVSDPVENGFYAFFVNGVPISDFITPSWYGSAGFPFDFTRKLTRPWSLGRHSYVSYYDVAKQKWVQKFTDRAHTHHL